MQTIKAIIILILMTFIIPSVIAQKTWNFSLKVAGTSSFFSLDKSSKYYTSYSKNWDKVTVDFKSKTGFAITGEVEKQVSDKVSLTVGLRFVNWGGIINSVRDGYTWDMDITYQSIDIPICAKYYFYKKNRIALYVKAGVGYSYTFNSDYWGKTPYGTGPVQHEKMELGTGFLSAELGAEYRITEKVWGLISIEVNNDMMFSNNRSQNNMNLLGITRIPINYNFVAIILGVKI